MLDVDSLHNMGLSLWLCGRVDVSVTRDVHTKSSDG